MKCSRSSGWGECNKSNSFDTLQQIEQVNVSIAFMQKTLKNNNESYQKKCTSLNATKLASLFR